MNLRAIIFMLAAVMMGAGLLHAQPAAAQKRVPKRGALFIGGDKPGNGLPRTDLLPTTPQMEVLGEKLSARQRNVDPFGLSTFPRDEDQPIIEDEMMRVTQRITLNQALQTLKINGVNLKHKEFLIGGRNACEGDVIELAFKNEIFKAQVIEVGPVEIQFRDLQRQESGVLRHSIIPQLQIEPLQRVANRFESRMTPMETPTPSQR
ncbi:MAG TPA: hypothetical protein VD994_14415 [Prosthecobacter sp.]|nr:hypothetical protein [Prosthecobacter sp.]